MKIVFSSIKNGSIFEPDFQNLSDINGTIEFMHKGNQGGIAVIYAPNGTGKSSLTKVLGTTESSNNVSFLGKDDSKKEISPINNPFHIIPDQIYRNVIPGKETDYLIGQQIRREYELRDNINSAFKSAYSSLARYYKTEFKVHTVNSFLLIQAKKEIEPSVFRYIRSIINSKSHGKDIDQNEFIKFIQDNKHKKTQTAINANKREWVIKDISEKNSITEAILGVDCDVFVTNQEIEEIERHDDAIKIIKKHHGVNRCIVCDNQNYDENILLSKKEENRKRIYDNLDEKTRKLFDKITSDQILDNIDPFDIKRIVKHFAAGKCTTDFRSLQKELKGILLHLIEEMVNQMGHCFDETNLLNDYKEYVSLVTVQPKLDSEELLFIEEIINENIGKNIVIERDPNSKNYKLKLGNRDLIGTERDKMELSTGEQNFISLAFELLLARHSKKNYVVMDDPISSFDSVYKNKIAFCIIKFLENKNQIILTHNTDLVRLLDVQLNNCFNLYILNNTEKGKNGFIFVSNKEKELLINLHKLIKLFQNDNNELMSIIRNKRLFLMAMIPFMRGYAHISLDNNDYYGHLSRIMHGYETGSLNVVPIYKNLFGFDFGYDEKISVNDVLSVNCGSLQIIDSAQYPLLANTLEQALVYYHLRMKVEKILVKDFGIRTNDCDTLNQIIQKAFRCNDKDPYYDEKKSFRVFFASRKTLLNEFNHFEGNINIFQPAIDISQNALQKEIIDIENKLKEVKVFARKLSENQSC